MSAWQSTRITLKKLIASQGGRLASYITQNTFLERKYSNNKNIRARPCQRRTNFMNLYTTIFTTTLESFQYQNALTTQLRAMKTQLKELGTRGKWKIRQIGNVSCAPFNNQFIRRNQWVIQCHKRNYIMKREASKKELTTNFGQLPLHQLEKEKGQTLFQCLQRLLVRKTT